MLRNREGGGLEARVRKHFMNTDYRLFAWNFSYFSAKVRAYCRYKAHHGAFTFEEILATQEILRDHMVPATGSNVVPQIEGADGRWLQDSSEIIDVLEARHPEGPVVPEGSRQRLVSYLIELLADEWMLPWAFWERWHYSLASVQPNHEAFNAQQWGRVFAPGASGLERREAARFVFREIMKIDHPGTAIFGPYAGLRQLGVTERTEAAWTASMRRMLGHLEAHFDRHDYVLGGRPTLADFALLGPLYPHLYKDPVPGFMMRTEYPLVCEWIERANGTTEAGTRSYAETSYCMNEGRLVPCGGASDGGELLADDAVPETLHPLISVFFAEMWPVLRDSARILGDYLTSGVHPAGSPLPSKSFYSPGEFRALQESGGPLSLEFEIGGVRETRWVSPYQIWMLGRMSDAMAEPFAAAQSRAELESLLRPFDGGSELLSLPELIAPCRLRKEFEQLYPAGPATS